VQQQQQQQRTPSYNSNDYFLATIGWLMFPAQLGAAFTRHRFGVRALGNPGRYVLGTLAFAGFHDIGGIVARTWHNPPFLHSIAWDYFLVMIAVSLWRALEAWWAFRRRAPRHSYFFGEPYLMLLGIPYRLACALDAAMIFGFGVWVRHYDVALGIWLMVGACGLAMLLLGGVQAHFKDTADLMDAGHYANIIQDRVERPDTASIRRPSAPSADEEELSTSAPCRRK